MHQCRTLWLLILWQIGSVSSLPQDIAQPTPYVLQPVFSDDFTKDTRGDYVITGDISWESGRMTLQSDASIGRTINVGAWASVDLTLELPKLTAADPASELQLWFELEGATDCFVRIRSTPTDRGQKASVALFDTNEENGRPINVLVREATLESADVNRLAVEYRYGLTQIWVDDAMVLMAYIRNGSAAVAGSRIMGSRASLNWISTSGIPAERGIPALGELTAEQKQQLAIVKAASTRMDVLYDEGKFSDAISIGEEIIQIRKEVLGEHHIDTAQSLNNLATLYHSQGNYDAAEPLLLQALKIWESARGPDHPDPAKCRSNLAALYCDLGNYAAAEPHFLRAMKIHETVFGPGHPDTATSLNNLAYLYDSQGNYADAEPLYLRALTIWESSLGPDDPATAMCLNNLGLLYKSQSNYAAAEPLFRRALKIDEEALGPDHPDTATDLNNLALLYSSQTNFAAAEPLFQRALKIDEKALGPDHPDTATDLINLAELYRAQRNYAAAEPLYLRALKIDETAQGPDHPHAAMNLDNLAGMYMSQGKYAVAEPLYQTALRILERSHGPDHPDTATSLNNLGELYRVQANFAAAELHNQQALKIYEKVMGSDHPATATSLNNLAMLRWDRNQADAGAPLAERALGIKLRHLDETAAIQTEQQQFLMSRDVECDFSFWLTVSGTNAQWTSAVYGDVLAWKGLITARQQGLRQVVKDDPLFAEFRRVTQQLSAVSLNPPLPPSDPNAMESWKEREPELRRNWESRKATLEAEHEDLEKQLASKSVPFRESLEQRRVRSEDLVATLKAQDRPTALVDVLEYGYYGRKEKGEEKERRIVAFVVRGDQPVVRVELGSAEAIGEQVAQWRDAILQKTDGQQLGEELRKRVWLPLEPHLQGIDTVLVSTDGVLGLLPFEALPGKADGTLLIEDYRLAYVPVPQLIPGMLSKPGRSFASERLLLVGDVDYGSDAAGESTPWKPLGGTAEELQALSKLHLSVFPAADGFMALRGADATEGQVVERLGKFQILHFATHGLFEQQEHRLIPSSQAFAGSRGAELLSSVSDHGQQTVKVARSGLVLAGANHRPDVRLNGSEPEVTDDGLLMENEILAMSLENASLVVMSACDTAQGKQQGGEGLLGIQRAFQVAGARTTIASLWQVDDAATVLLMQRFYENLWSGKLSRLDALRDAQLWMLRSGKQAIRESARRAIARGQETRGAEILLDDLDKSQNDRLPPYYWAAFVLSGDWR